ncbi:hypothetical protein OH77DRAFT_1521868 [Trametes cingulata]|nr:hypothetical protein OH77DRAFT_1521868 [Trametes cingulata]
MSSPHPGDYSPSGLSSTAGSPTPTRTSVSAIVPAVPAKPKIRICTISSAYLAPFPAAQLLDSDRNNWTEWKDVVSLNLQLSGGLHRYLSSAYPCPDASVFPDAAANWVENDDLVRAYIRKQSTAAERKRQGTTYATAAHLWRALEAYHVRQGPHAQVLVLRELLELRFDTSSPLLPQAERAAELAEKVVAMGALDADPSPRSLSFL